MITYVDASLLLKLVIEEEGSERAGLIWDSADVLASVVLVVVEERAALAAARRGGRLDSRQHKQALQEFNTLIGALSIVEVTEGLVDDASHLAESEALRGYEAVHLAAALSIGSDILTSSDTTLFEAANRRGLHVANPLST